MKHAAGFSDEVHWHKQGCGGSMQGWQATHTQTGSQATQHYMHVNKLACHAAAALLL
jgi:hypothetical protein